MIETKKEYEQVLKNASAYAYLPKHGGLGNSVERLKETIEALREVARDVKAGHELDAYGKIHNLPDWITE